MVSKNNRKMMNERNRDEKQRFSIRKLSVGAASVLIGISFMTFGASQVSANTVDVDTTQNQGNAPETDTESQEQVSENSDQSQAEEGLNTETEDTNNEIVDTDESAVPTTDNSEVVSEEGTETTSNPEENKNVAGNTDQSEKSDSADPTTTDLVVKKENATPFNAQALKASLVEDNSTAVVKTADELTKALSDKNIKTIKVAGDITLNSNNFDNTRDVTIVGDKKADGSKYTVDFGDKYLNGSADQSVTYDNLNLRGQNYYGLIKDAGTSTFKDIDFEGSQMVFSGNDATINFEGTVTAKTVNKYKNLAGQEVKTKEVTDTADNPQQLLEFGTGHAGTINFKSGSNVTLGTVSGNVIQLAGADNKKNIINVEAGANVTLKPHTGTNVEGVGFANYHIANGIARGIYMKTKGTLNVAKGGTLNIVSGKGADDKLPSSGIYLSAGSEINNNGKLVVEASGDITAPQDIKENKTVAPIFIDGNATINDNGDFQVNAKDLGAYSGALINVNGQGHINVGNTDPNSTAAKVNATFAVTSTGTSTGNVTGVQLGTGSVFKADQPTSFSIDLSNNNSAKAVRNGKIDFTGVKNEDSAPLGESFIQYDANGNVENSKITAAAENTVNDVTANIKKNPNKVSFTAAGKQDVQVSDVHLEKQADGTYKLTGKVTPGSTADAPSYVNVKLDGKKLDVPNGPTQKVFTNDNGKTTSKDQASAAKVNEDGTFSVILPASMVENLKDTDKLQVSAVNSFVESSPVDKKPVASPSDVKVDDNGKVTGKAPAGSTVTVTLKDGTKIPVTAGENGTFEAQLTSDQFKEQAGKPVSVTSTNSDGDTAIVDKEIVNKNDLKDSAAAKNVDTTKATKEYTEADADAQKAYKDAVDAANKVISNPDATQKDVNDALQKVEKAKEGLKASAKGLNDAKAKANEEIEAAAQKAKDAIQDLPTLTQEEKDAAKADVDNHANAAKEAIKNATSADATKVDSTAINNDVKDAAKKDIDAAEVAKNAKIDASNLTDEEKAAKKEETNKAADKAKNTIDGATKPEDVTKEINTGKEAIEAVVIPETSDSKEAAKKKIEKAAEDAKTAIEGNQNLTDDEKAKAKSDVDKHAQDAMDVIDKAKSNDDVKTATDNGTNNLNKDAAKAAIQEALNTKLAAIENAKHLTPEEVTTFTNLAKNAASAADSNIDSAANTDAVEGAKNDGLEAINGVEIPGVDVAKKAAKDAIAKALEDKTRDINNAANLTDDEKQDLIKQATAIADQADKNIDAATTDATINNIATKGEEDIKNVLIPTLDDAKKKANDDIDKAAEDAKNTIDALPTLTDEEKATAKKAVDDHAAAAKKQVESAKNDADAEKTAKDGSDTVNKDAAKSTIDDAKKAKDAKIDESNLTDEEKVAKKEETKQAADDAKTAIDGATKPEDVTKETNTGKDNIDKVTIPTSSKEKEAAKDAIDNKADQAKKAIDDNKNLTDEEKQAAKDDIDKHAQDAKDAIDNAKNNNDVKKATDEGNDKVNKDVAKAAVDDAKNAKDAAIDNSNLTDEEKAAKKEETKQAADDAKTAIDNADPEDVAKNIEDGKKNINDVDIPEKSPVKEAAKDEVDKAANDAKTAIDNNKNLTDDQKQAAKDNVDKKADDAKDNIDAAKKNADVDAAKNNGTTNVNRESAKAAVQDELNKKNKEIADSALTDDEKKIKSDLAQQYAKDAFAAIDNAKDTQAVKDESTKGVNNISGIDIPETSPAKDNANQAINDALNKKNKEIDKADNLSDAEKQALKDDAKKIADDAKKAIKNANNDKGVAEARDQAVLDIADVTVPSLDDAKNNAKDMIDKTLAEKTKEITDAKHLTDDEKADLLKKVTEEVVDAKNNIDAADKNDDVKLAEENGVKAIEAVVVPSQKDVTDKAKDAIEQVSEAKKNSIDGANNLSDVEKQALKEQVDKAADEAKDAIDKAGDDAKAIKSAQDNGIDAIVDIEIPTLDSAKKNATQAIDDAKKSKTDEINKADHLTADEKADLIKKATDEANTAKNNIEAATTNDIAKAASEEGVHSILGVKVPSLDEVKLDALKDVDKALNDKTDEINASDLSNAEKQSLIDQANSFAAEAKNNIKKVVNSADAKKVAQDGVNKIKAIKVESASYDNGEGVIDGTASDSNASANTQVTDTVGSVSDNDKGNNSGTTENAENNNLAKKSNKKHSNSSKSRNTQFTATKTGNNGKHNISGSVIEGAGRNENNRVEDQNANSKSQLPATGEKNTRAMTAIGAAMAGVVLLLGLWGIGKKKD